AVSNIDLLGFNFGQLLKGMRHTLHAIGMILFDQRLVGLFNFLDCSGLGNAEDADPVLIALEREGCRNEIFGGSNIELVYGFSRPDIGEISEYAEFKAVLPAQTITSDIINQRRSDARKDNCRRIGIKEPLIEGVPEQPVVELRLKVLGPSRLIGYIECEQPQKNETHAINRYGVTERVLHASAADPRFQS